MQRVSLSWVVENLRGLNHLASLDLSVTGAGAWAPLFIAQSSLSGLLRDSVYSQHFRVSKERANTLYSTLENLLPPKDASVPEDFSISQSDYWSLSGQREQLEIVLLAEMATLPVYLITPKEAFDLDSLIDNGTSLFPPSMVSKAPRTKIDALEAGRCLAFERNTACGFHTFRVVEEVLRKYWDEVSANKPRPEPETLGTMAGQLEICGFGDKKVIEALKQMTKLHRNPISHPDVILTGDEAIATVGMARSVITHMLPVLKDVPPTTGGLAVP